MISKSEILIITQRQDQVARWCSQSFLFEDRQNDGEVANYREHYEENEEKRGDHQKKVHLLEANEEVPIVNDHVLTWSPRRHIPSEFGQRGHQGCLRRDERLVFG